MCGRLYPFVILLIFGNIFKASCGGSSSLTFVIDDTGSMGDDIYQVKASANQIMDIVFNEKSSLIKNMVLVTVNDPDSQLRAVTTNRQAFKTALQVVYAHNQDPNMLDCWEPSMKGLIMALENSLPESYIYVFTDASAKDYIQKPAVIELCQRKQTQIVFVLTGDCDNIYNHYTGGQDYRVYYDIATACAGLVIKVDKKDVHTVIPTIEETIKGNKTVIGSWTVPPRSKIAFTIDDQTEYVIVSATGSNVYLKVTGNYVKSEWIMSNSQGKVLKIYYPSPGKYVATVDGDSTVSVVVVGRTDFIFSHGFSKLQPKTLGDTSPQPIADTNVYLSISVTDPTHSVRIESAQILQMDETPIHEKLPLTELSKDFYITKPFVAPNQRFKVAVKGTVISTGRPIRRIAKIPITPQAPPIKLPDKTKPTAHIVEGKSIEVEYDSTVKLTCKVTAYPNPKIEWINSKGVRMASKSSVLEGPYKHISYITVSNVVKGDKYVCYAVNDEGKDSKTISVVVQDPLVVKSAPAGTSKIVYGKEGTLKCNIKSKLPIQIHWYYANEITGANGQIGTSDKYWISPDGTEMKIKKMDLDLVGRYTCKASLMKYKDPDVEKSFSTRVKVDGLAPPKVTGPTAVKAVKGTTAVLQCQVTNGLPKPKISWLFMDKSDSKLVGSESVLRIPSVQEKHAGRYRCLAENVAGTNELVTTLIIQELPKITTNHLTVLQGVEGDGHLSIPCSAVGAPQPVITWKLNSRVITPSAKYSIVNGALVISEPKVTDTNSYTCEAKNEVGSVSATFQTHILQSPKVSGEAFKKVRLGATAYINCMVVKGEPKPKITWQFMGNSASKFAPMAGTENVLRISTAEKKHAGQYKCLAQNSVGSDEHVTTLIVEYLPEINTKQTIYEAVEGDVALRVPCDVVGVPQPEITWKLKGATITPNVKYVIEDGALVIMNPTEADSKSYTCEAKNYIGTVSATYKVEVKKSLESFGDINQVYLLNGETRKLKCKVYTSKSQSVQWFNEAEPMDIDKPYIELVEVSGSNDGNYTCRVTDKHGHTQTHTYVVDVGYPPKLNSPTIGNDWRGDIDDILTNCDSRAKPPAHITWTFNGQMLSNRNVTELGITYKWGHYTCNVSNVHGSEVRNFDVKSSSCLIHRNLRDAEYMPLLLTADNAWPTWETTKHYSVVNKGEKITLSCPNRKEGSNAFQKFPKQNELKAICIKQDTFSVDGTLYKLSDLQCAASISPSVIRKNVKCSTEKSELLRVGYNVNGFLETYEVCFDHAKNIPHYTRTLITEKGGSITAGVPYNWYKYPGIGDGTHATGFICNKTLSSCCYSKSQLVNARDFNDGPAKYSTFIDPINVIPSWHPCNTSKTKWEDIDGMVRKLLLVYDEFVVWSGTHTLQEQNGAIIPRYLWKVIRFNEEEAIAVVHVNDQSPTAKDIKCENTCTQDEDPWFRPSDEYTYCCSVSEFLDKFGMRGTEVEDSLEDALAKIESST